MNTQEIKEKFIDFCHGSALYGERNSNRADSYNCPSCYKSIDIEGYCCPTTSINELVHEEDCALYNMYKLIKLEIEGE